MKDQPVQCVWFKRDLRVSDHAPLTEAAKKGPVLAVYLVEPKVINAPDFDALHWSFIQESLDSLRESLRSLGTDLILRRGEAVQELERLRREFHFQNLWSHEETGNNITFQRDRRVAKWAREVNVDWVEFPQNGVVRQLMDRDGWSKQWEKRMREPVSPTPHQIISPEKTEGTVEIPNASTLGLIESDRKVDMKGGEEEGWKTLESFLQGRGRRYHREMSSPVTAYEGCSRLSAYLAWGCLSMKSVVQAARDEKVAIPKTATRSFLSRCHWHCHFMQKLETEPAIEFHCFNRSCDGLRNDGNDPERLAAWQEGRTGYPFVDACIRSLKTRGWINFRMRAMLVSFAAYDLWLDWRTFKDWLACQFIDYEPGIHISQVQMQSGVTGINTLRIYSPVKQGKDHDPDGNFIREWVPELRDTPNDAIHEPWLFPEHRSKDREHAHPDAYPAPIVDHRDAVREARAAFGRLRKTDEFWTNAEAVMQKHGSRKSRENRNRPKRAKRHKESQTEFTLGS